MISLAGLAHPAVGDQDRVPAVQDIVGQDFRFELPVAEIGRSEVLAGDDERIVWFHIPLLINAKILFYFQLFKL